MPLLMVVALRRRRISGGMVDIFKALHLGHCIRGRHLILRYHYSSIQKLLISSLSQTVATTPLKKSAWVDIREGAGHKLRRNYHT